MADPTRRSPYRCARHRASANPQLTAAVMMKLSAPPSSARPASRIATDIRGGSAEAEREKIECPAAAAASRPATTPRFAPRASEKLPRPRPRDQRSRELAAGHQTHHERAETQAVVHMEGRTGIAMPMTRSRQTPRP